jgi:TldD protein
MTNLIQTATEFLLNPVNLNTQDLENAVNQAMGKSIDYADIYLQSRQAENWSLEDGIVKDSAFSIDRGFGLRVVSGEKTGFAYADDINQQTLIQAARSAKSIAHQSGVDHIAHIKNAAVASLYPALNPLNTLKESEKVDLLRRVDRYVRDKDPRVLQVMVSLSGQYEVVLIINNEGMVAADVRPLVYLSLRVVVEENGRREYGVGGGGARCGYEMFQSTAFTYADKAVRQALLNLTAKPAPAGTMSVVLGPGWPGILLHEAIGHGLEGDFNRKGSSAFSNRLGEQVASSLCTVVDDGTIPGRRGSLTIDDEGTVGQKTVLIENGLLKNYMQDRLNARLMNMQPTGNGRRESYAHLPLPRMTNTYMLPGASEPAEIIASVKNGLYAVDFSGGQVDITSGKFVFSASEAYLIENGKITAPVKGATLIGNGPDVLTKVSMVGNDLALDNGLGSCGKAGQTIPVGVGQPTIKVDALTVGGVQ